MIQGTNTKKWTLDIKNKYKKITLNIIGITINSITVPSTSSAVDPVPNPLQFIAGHPLIDVGRHCTVGHAGGTGAKVFRVAQQLGQRRCGVQMSLGVVS